MCADGGGRGVRNKEASKHCESVSSRAHKYSSLVLISPTHAHTHARSHTHALAHSLPQAPTNNSGSPQHSQRHTYT